MTPDHWRKIKEILQEALELGPKERRPFLDRACAGDGSLREEVQSLLDSEDSIPSGFLQSPPALGSIAADESGQEDRGVDPHAATDAAGFPLAGRTLSHYRILEGIGGGGMGVVYKAQDMMLPRFVALKFLPEHLFRDQQALERLKREAQAASSLNHRNICTIYEISEHEGRPFIVMEYLDGQTLRDRLRGRKLNGRDSQPGSGPGPAPPPPKVGTPGGAVLPTEELLELAVQIADGLEAVHAEGIIHRDIKPANIFVTRRGNAKILDFGVAKLSGSAVDPLAVGTPCGPSGLGGAPALPGLEQLTRTGATLGTMAYMSPEQIRGEKLDARTDLFSLGLVLYEMAAGHTAFTGDTVAAVQDAILRSHPRPAREANPQLPPGLEIILTRSLEKGCDARYQTAAEIRSDLERLKSLLASHHEAGTESGQHSPVPGRRRLAWPAVLGTVAALGLVLLVAGLIRSPKEGPSTGPLRIAPFTGLSAPESQPAFSPDGKQLAYVLDDGTATAHAPANPHPLGHIYVRRIGGGSPLQLTHDALYDQDPSWSPDGRYIAFIRNWSGHGAIRMAQVISVPASGGPERRLAEIDGKHLSRGVTWSPDGKSVVTNVAPDVGLFLVSTEGGEKHRLTSPPQGDAWDTDPAFSTDGRTLAFVRRTGLYLCDIYLQNVKTANARRLTFDGATIWGLAWTPDGRYIVFSSKRAGFATLWKVRTSGGEIEPLAGVGPNAFFPAVSPRGNLLAYANQELNVNVWRAQITPSRQVEATKIISGSGLQVDDAISPDGKRVAFASDRSGDLEIWVANIDDTNPLQLTSLRAPLTGSPSWSPDGRWIAFNSHPGEHSGVFVISAQGGTPRRLTPPGIDALVPGWSRDGSSVYFSGGPEENWGIWKMPAQGGDAVRITDGFGSRESDDGSWLYFGSYRDSPRHMTAILRTPLAGGPRTLVYDGVTQRLWTLGGHCLYFMDFDARLHATINCMNLATGKVARIADVPKVPYTPLAWAGLSVSSDGASILYPQLDQQTSRIMLVENFH